MNEHVALQTPVDAGYDADFSAWSLRQAELIRSRRFDLVDADNIAEEIENLARKDLHSAEKRLRTLIEHLLKLKLFTLSEDPKRGWRITVIKTRMNLASTFRDSPSLFAQRDLLFDRLWPEGVRIAKAGLIDDNSALAQIDGIAAAPVFTVAQLLDPDFFPGD